MGVYCYADDLSIPCRSFTGIKECYEHVKYMQKNIKYYLMLFNIMLFNAFY